MLRRWWLQIIAVASLLSLSLSAVSFAKPVVYRNAQLDREQLDTGMMLKGNATRQAASVSQVQAPGVVGLDLLIFLTEYPLVQGVFPATSAEQQGVQAGDRILQINQQSTLGKSRTQIDEMISDKIGDRVHLLITREQHLKSITLTVLPAPSSY